MHNAELQEYLSDIIADNPLKAQIAQEYFEKTLDDRGICFSDSTPDDLLYILSNIELRKLYNTIGK